MWLWIKTNGTMGAPPILLYFSGNWDVHCGYGILTHGRVATRQRRISQANRGLDGCQTLVTLSEGVALKWDTPQRINRLTYTTFPMKRIVSKYKTILMQPSESQLSYSKLVALAQVRVPVPFRPLSSPRVLRPSLQD